MIVSMRGCQLVSELLLISESNFGCCLLSTGGKYMNHGGYCFTDPSPVYAVFLWVIMRENVTSKPSVV